MPRTPWIGLAVMAGLALGVRPAGALKPCFDVCHLGQGQPLLLADADELWVRRCVTPKPGALETCVLERVDVNGGVLERVLLAQSYDEEAFQDAHLRGHTIVRLDFQTAWTDLTKPYKLAPYGARGSKLGLDRDALVCAPAGAMAPVIRRPLGCAPRGVYVFAAGVGRSGKPEDPAGTVAVVATCAAGSGTHEVVAICRPAR
jgi:hypothetical protein